MILSALRLALLSSLVFLCCLVTLGTCPVHAQTEEPAPVTWSELRAEVSAFVEQGQFEEALALIDKRASKLRDREFEVSSLTLEVLFEAGRADEALAAWEHGIEKGFFYFVVPRMATYNAVRKDDRFRALLARNNQLRKEASSKSKPEYKVITPASYSGDESYPLLVVIHGGNQSIAKAMETWNPAFIGDNLIIAYVQSSIRADSKSYRWDLGGVDIYHLPTAQDEVLGLYQTIVREYAVDTERVALAGFSQGGNLSLIMAAEGTILARGFIAGCPATRDPISPEVAEAAAARGLRGTLFVGVEDWTAATAQTSVRNLNDAGLSIHHIVMEGKGHEYPDNFDDVLREAVKRVFQ